MSAYLPPTFTSSGILPPQDSVRTLLEQTHAQFKDLHDGQVSDVYPALAQADPNLFGLAIVGVQGVATTVGDAAAPFALMSVAKPFTLALAFDDHGIDHVIDKVGIEATGLPFNSAQALDRDPLGRTNPMVNSGALATASLIRGADAPTRWGRLLARLSAFAGRDLTLDHDTLTSALATNHVNRELARILDERGALDVSAADTVDLYTRQSCVSVTAIDLAVMGATLADGGLNPVTGQHVTTPETTRAVLAAMTVAGLYEGSGRWLLDVGLPGKSGIGGGIVTVSPGKGALGSFSAPLDHAGNSTRGVAAARQLSRALGLDILASEPVTPSGGGHPGQAT
jgi:glutaminase